jgi:chromosome segregation ATPase
MLLINSEMADLRVRLSALQAQALEAEQRWQRAESAAAAAESRLSESSHLQDSAYQSALGQIRDARDALASKLDEQQQRIRSMCSRLRSSLSSLPVQSSEGPSPSNDSLEQLELLLGKVESVVLRVSVGDAATPLP